MTQLNPPIVFRAEWVSGVVATEVDGSSAALFVANRGQVQGWARAFVYLENVQILDSDNAQQQLAGRINPGHVWVFTFDTQGFRPYWVRIFTTSNSLVPSLAFRRLIDQGQGTPHASDYTRVMPGDFAVFDLPFRPLDVRAGEGNVPILGQ
jgi:hypothetical protein